MSTTGSESAACGSLPREVAGFRLLKELGRGGMGVVYEAEELATGRRVALKVLAASLAVSDEALERFRREARLAAAISDTRCVFVYGAHEIEGAPAIAMELCGSETLEDRVRSGEPVPIRTAVRWIIEVLDGLEAAHRSGVLHRDVKPSNCFLGPDGRVKIGDFGLARTLERDIHLTQSGTFLGSPLYASPEQIRGRDVDLRSDLYSCGATFYALLTGRSPFTGQGMGEVLARILSESVPKPRSIRPEIPSALESVVLRAMAKDPGRRYGDHAAFRAALQGFVSEHTPGNLVFRSVAFAIDLALRSGIQAASFVLAIGLWVAIHSGEPSVELPLSLLSLLAWIEDFLYFALCEGCFGATPGKWLMGQRVVAVSTGHRSLPRAAARAGVFLVPSLLALAVLLVPDVRGATPAYFSIAVSAVFGLLFLSTMRLRNGYRAVHELASGTRVIQVPPVFARRWRPAANARRTQESASGLPATVGPYQVEGAIGSTPLGPLVRARDPGLGRTVWLQTCVESGPSRDDARRSLARPGRLRWLGTLSEQGVRYEVFEDPGGAAFTDIAHAGLDWPHASRLLLALAEELAHSAQGVCLEQLWIDRAGDLRLLDQPTGSGSFQFLSPLELLGATARTMCLGTGRTGLPPDLPHGAEETVRRLCGLGDPFEDVGAAQRALAALTSRSYELTRRMRATQVTAAVIASSLVLLVMAGASFFLAIGASLAEDSARFERLLTADLSSAALRAASPESDEDHRARLTLIGRHLSMPGFGEIRRTAEGERREIMEEASRFAPRPTSQAVREAAERLTSRARAGGLDPEDVYDESSRPANRALGWSLSGFVALGLILAFALRGGLSLKLFGMHIRDRRGAQASRLRCAWRALILWSPFFLLVLPIAALPASADEILGPLALAALAIYGVGAVWTIAIPAHGPHDLLAGTRIVPH